MDGRNISLIILIVLLTINEASAENSTLVIIHASLMTFAWIFLAPMAIILARYYRRFASKKHLCGYPVWFPLHFLCAFFCVACSIAAFILILWEKDWLWVSSNLSINFAHSIAGIIGLGLACLQFVYSGCRPSLGSSGRDLFNKVHFGIGAVAFLAATVALYIALYIARMKSGWEEIGIMMGWLIWLYLVLVLLEILRFFDNQYLIKVPFPNTYPNEIHNRFDTVRKFILLFHFLVSLGIATAMIVFLSLSTPDPAIE